MARSLRERLQSLQQSVSQSSVQLEETREDCGTVLPHDSLEKLGFVLRQGGRVDFPVREIRYDVLTLHGRMPFQAIFAADLSGLYALVGHPFEIADLRFYDTETTGLGTGAGTFAFLHTIGRLEHDEFCLYQYFVDDYSAEESILTTIEEEHFSPSTILVTFNGKSFDWPMLQGRRAMYRMEKQEVAGHIDLLHPARRFWRKKLESVSLVSVEAHVLGLVRQDDLPGKEAPARYFQYVSERDPLIIQPILEHNAMDVSSLVGILTVVANLLSGRVLPETAETYTALARYFTEWNDYDMAAKCYQAATDYEDATWSTYWRKSMFLKRMGQLDDARQVWKDIADTFPDSVAPLVELAKVAEHKDKDYELAQKWAELALERYRNNLATRDFSQGGKTDGSMGPLGIPYRVGQHRASQNQARQHQVGQHQVSQYRASQHQVIQPEISADEVGQVADGGNLPADRIYAELAHRLNRITRKKLAQK
jgi:uncharacterized protein